MTSHLNNDTCYEPRDVIRLVRAMFKHHSIDLTTLRLSMRRGKSIRVKSEGLTVIRDETTYNYMPATEPGGIEKRCRVPGKAKVELHVSVWLPAHRNETALPLHDVQRLAMMVVHETSMHASGVTDWYLADIRWAAGMVIRKKAVAPKPTLDERVAKREYHARKMLARAEADYARVIARLAKWEPRVKYYDNKPRRTS